MRTMWLAVVLVAACTSAQGETQSTFDSTSAEDGHDSGTPIVDAQPGSLSCWTATPGDGGGGDFVFTDVTEEVGLVKPLVGMHGHGAIWTDLEGDGQPDLFFGTFADRSDDAYQHRGAEGPSPDRMLRYSNGSFTSTEWHGPFTRSSGGATADLDGDGDLDLVVSRNIKEGTTDQVPTTIYENIDGRLVAVENAGIPADLGARAVGVFDYDRDGLYDVFIAEDRWTGGSSVLLHNEGGLEFRDATTDANLPTDVHGLGVAVADFNNDQYLDLFVAGSNRMFFANESGGFEEQDSSVFVWEYFGEEDDVAGASVADVNRDGSLDLVLGHHFNSTLEFDEQVAVRLYLNDGLGTFTDVTEEAGLTPLPTKAPHVELNDVDNDGWPDLVTSASAGASVAVFGHEGLDGGIPMFSTPEGLGDSQYWVSAPTVDYDRDGRLDVLLVEWEPSRPSLMLRNESESGGWLEVSVGPDHGRGLGWRVEIFDGNDLIGARDITVTQGYSAGVLPIAHFGLGDVTEVTVLLTPPGGEPIKLDSVAANQHIRWPSGCS